MVRTLVRVNGRVTPPEEAVVPALDRGFLYGDSVYEVIWWHRGVPVQAVDHMTRLRESARRIYMEIPGTDALYLEEIRSTLAAAGCGPDEDAYVRLVVTRGVTPIGLRFEGAPTPTVVVVVAPAHRPTKPEWEAGLHLALVDRLRVSARALDPAAKTGNYMNNLHEANARGADDGVLLNDRGEVTEGTTSNVYVVARGAVETPPLDAGILKGTTRTRVLALCRANGIPALERVLKPADLSFAEEVFLSSSVRGIIPATRVDGRPVGDGKPGPMTRRIHALFEAAADAEASGGAAAPPRG
jgi:branched-chain amino acid aminotransferase